MSKARLVITALFVDHQSPAEVAARYGVHRAWVYKLKARYEAEGEAVLEPRSRRPKSSPRATPSASVDLVLSLRKQLGEAGLDAGADTIGWHLSHHHALSLSRATINRILVRAGTVTPDPSKRPKSSYIRFEADQPNECWQSDFTHYRLTTPGSRPDRAPGAEVEIISWLDDHARYALGVTAHVRVTGPIVLSTFRQAADLHGYPASTLTDNGMVYTTRLSGGSLRGTRGRNAFETELHQLGIVQKNSRPNHPTTCGRSNGSSRPSRSGFERNAHSRPPWPSFRPSSTPSGRSTTTAARTAPSSTDPHPPPPTKPDPKPPQAAARPSNPTTGSAATGSTPPGWSPSATPAASTTSASGEPTPEPTS